MVDQVSGLVYQQIVYIFNLKIVRGTNLFISSPRYFYTCPFQDIKEDSYLNDNETKKIEVLHCKQNSIGYRKKQVE